MNTTTCLSESDLILCHYGDLPAAGPELRHLASCPECSCRLDALSSDLAQLPKLQVDVDAACATRMAARVGEQLQRRSSRRRNAFRGALTVAATLVVAIIAWQPANAPQQARQPVTQVVSSAGALPDIDLLDDLELLEDLELLRQLEGV